MKRNKLMLGAFCLAISLSAGLASCGDDKKEEVKKPAAAQNVAKGNLPNYRYVDLDSIVAKYNLAKDYNEEMVRMQSNAESQLGQKQKAMQTFAQQVQSKMQNNGYLTQESYQQDEQHMANLQRDYENSANTIQNNILNANVQAQKAINDSVTSFIESYNKARGYDAIFVKQSTLYINPALDITDEVIEGLNARYNKVK